MWVFLHREPLQEIVSIFALQTSSTKWKKKNSLIKFQNHIIIMVNLAIHWHLRHNSIFCYNTNWCFSDPNGIKSHRYWHPIVLNWSQMPLMSYKELLIVATGPKSDVWAIHKWWSHYRTTYQLFSYHFSLKEAWFWGNTHLDPL